MNQVGQLSWNAVKHDLKTSTNTNTNRVFPWGLMTLGRTDFAKEFHGFYGANVFAEGPLSLCSTVRKVAACHGATYHVSKQGLFA